MPPPASTQVAVPWASTAASRSATAARAAASASSSGPPTTWDELGPVTPAGGRLGQGVLEHPVAAEQLQLAESRPLVRAGATADLAGRLAGASTVATRCPVGPRPGRWPGRRRSPSPGGPGSGWRSRCRPPPHLAGPGRGPVPAASSSPAQTSSSSQPSREANQPTSSWPAVGSTESTRSQRIRSRAGRSSGRRRGGQQLPPGGQPPPGAVGDGRRHLPDGRGQAAQVGERVGEGGRVDDQPVGDRGQLVEHLLVEGRRPSHQVNTGSSGSSSGRTTAVRWLGVCKVWTTTSSQTTSGPWSGGGSPPGPRSAPLAALGRLGDQDHAARGGAGPQLLHRVARARWPAAWSG